MKLDKSKKNRIYFGCALLCLSVQLSSMGLNNTMYAILTNMNGLQHYALLAVLSGMGLAIMTPIGGKLGDLFGRRNVALIGTVLSLACMAVMSITNDLIIFIVFRALLSFGLGMFSSLPFSISADIFEPAVYGKRVGFLQATLAAGIFLGSTIAGAMNDVGLLKLSMVYPGVICVAGALLVFVQMPNVKSKIKPVIDYAGIALLAIFITALSMAFSFAGTLGFGHPVILGGFVIAIVSAILLYVVDKKKEQPVVPFYLFKNKKYTGVCLLTGLIACHQIVMGVYVPVTGQALMGLSTTVTGFFTLPRTIVCIIMPLIAGIWVAKKPQRLRIAMIFSALSIFVAFGGMIFTSASTAIFVPFVLMAVTGIGEGFRGVSSTPMAVSTLNPKDIGIGIALVNTMGSLGPTIFSAAVGAAYTAKSAYDLTGALVTVYAIMACIGIVATLIAIFMLKDKKQQKVQA